MNSYSDGTSTYAMSRLMYTNKTYESTGKKKLGSSDSSQITMRKSMSAVGKTSRSAGFTALSHANGNLKNDALRRVRSSGSSVPKKVTNLGLVKAVVPDPPTDLEGFSLDSSLDIYFIAGYDGKSPITNYCYSLNGITFIPFNPPQTESPLRIDGLTNGTSYTIYLKAENNVGLSLASLPITMTPSTVPSAPSSLVATPLDGGVTISFTQTSNGGASIIEYAYSSDGENFSTLNYTSSPVTITGLTNNATYSIRLVAYNINGYSNLSEPVSFTPVATYYSTSVPTLSGKNLLFQLQGNDSQSYSGSGNIWYDVSPKTSSGFTSTQYNGSLNGPDVSYNSVKGSFAFASNSYINVPNSIGLQATTSQYRSFVVWAYLATEQSGKGIFSKMYGSSYGYDGYTLVFSSNLNLTLIMNGSSQNNYFSTTSNNVYSLTTWQMFTGVICFGGNINNPSKIYVNGIKVLFANSVESGLNPTAPIMIPRGIQEGSNYSNCRIGAVYYFDNALTDQDVVDIYNATKANYVLT